MSSSSELQTAAAVGMRLVCLSLLVLLAFPAFAQEPIVSEKPFISWAPIEHAIGYELHAKRGGEWKHFGPFTVDEACQATDKNGETRCGYNFEGDPAVYTFYLIWRLPEGRFGMSEPLTVEIPPEPCPPVMANACPKDTLIVFSE